MTHLDEQFIGYEKEINSFAKKICDGSENYKDLVQDSYLKMKRAEEIGSYVETGKFKGWIIRLVRNVFLDQFANHKRRFYLNFLSLDKKYNDAENEQGSMKSVLVENYEDDKKENEEEHIFWLGFKKVYNDLNPRFKEVIDLHTFDRIKHKEIAKRLNISVNTSLGRYRYGVLELRKEFN